MNNTTLALAALASTLISCHPDQPETNLSHEPALIFPRGEPITNDTFVGTAWLTMLVTADSTNHTAVGNVTFEPGARTNWHRHPAGQIVLVTGGVGYYQEQGRPKKILRKGDVVVWPPQVPHWHGASSDSVFVQLAITGREKGPTEWLQAVSEEYRR